MPMPTFFADFRLVAGATIARIRDAWLPRGLPRGLKILLVVPLSAKWRCPGLPPAYRPARNACRLCAPRDLRGRSSRADSLTWWYVANVRQVALYLLR